MKKKISIKFKEVVFKNIDELKGFQGELKTLSDENYNKLKDRIVELGFVEPVAVWKNQILNGHQRVTTLTRMRKEGYEIPDIPVAMITASNKKEAKKMVLSLTSQFGQMTEESLMTFIKEAELEVQEVIDDFAFDGLDMEGLDKFDDLPTEEDMESVETEINEEISTEHECPKCSYRW